MRVLVLNTDYSPFLDRLYGDAPKLAERSYADQMAARNASLFGVFDSYSRHLTAAGCEAWEIHANNEPMQKRWATEAGLDYGGPVLFQSQLSKRIAKLPILGRKFRRRPSREPWFLDILKSQIAHYHPDVILNQDVYQISGYFLRRQMGEKGLVVGQLASHLPTSADWGGYDLMISSLPNLVEYFSNQGLAAEFCPLGFDSAVYAYATPAIERDIPVLFVGSLTSQHQTRIELLEYLCRHIDIEIRGASLSALEPGSPVRNCVKGEAWGVEMYRLLGRAAIALNQHIDMAGPYANNCRLFEATGMGAMLLTDRKSNLDYYFKPGIEVADFGSPQECLERIRYFQDNLGERQRIAEAGRNRVLASHGYAQRMNDLAALFGRYLTEKRRAL
ncbi:MAG: glycosyltransferase family 1 protein [Alphaproteobacteria bacterium]|nr:glycosyltransferase family 1 protein [Alphaproteobacteria bacterium]